MKLARSIIATNLIFSLVLVSFLSLITVPNISAQDSNVALQRGYRTGYSDGYMNGYRDAIGNATKSYSRHADYETADRAYNQDYGQIEIYRDGYQQGFEVGYDAGFGKSSFDAALPGTLAVRGVVIPEKTAVLPKVEVEASNDATVIEPIATNTDDEIIEDDNDNDDVAANQDTDNVTYEPKASVDTVEVEDIVADNTGTADAIVQNSGVKTQKIKYQPTFETNEDIIVIPRDTELIVELIDDVSTERSREGDAFKARVISPIEISGSIIEGRVTRIQAPGRLKRRSELLLSFDRIILTENRWSNFNAVVTEVLPVKGDNVKRVDPEGTVEGTRRYKTDAAKVGASTGTGMLVGGLIGGPVGVAVGAGVGAAFGVGAIVVERGKHIKLQPNQQIRIKTNYETQIR